MVEIYHALDGARRVLRSKGVAVTSAFFGQGAVRFLKALTANNTKAFFDAHRADYEREILTPLWELVAIAEPRYGRGRVMRQHRDLRFSRDKTPYRTTASMWAGGIGAVYLRLSTGGLDVGGGLYEPSREQLARARQAIAEDHDAANQLLAVIEALADDGYELAGESLKTAPRGFPPDHPHIELLRLRHYAALRHLPATATLDEIQRTWVGVQPLLNWIESRVGESQARNQGVDH
jgi:uncharacterized protein (TIGR02453 family)